MIDELWRNWYADHIVVRELDPATKVADDVKRKNYRVKDPSGFPKLNLKERSPGGPDPENPRIPVPNKLPSVQEQLRSLEMRMREVERALNLQNEGYPGLQGEDVTTVANGPPRKK